MANDTVHEMVTERILAMLAEGTVPWRKPWQTIDGMGPRNLVSGKEYRGINVFLLACTAYESPYWLTFKQAATLGGSVRKGEKGTVVVFWKINKYAGTDKKTGKPAEQSVPMLRYYRVWNVAQCENVRIPKGRELTPIVRTEVDTIDAAETVVAGYKDGPSIGHGGGSAAYYRPAADSVTMPERDAFNGATEYYSTLFHELGHSTGHSSRLARFGEADYVVHPFGSAEYGREELIAEMTSAFLCGETGILPGTIENSAAYIASWVRAIKDDTRAVVVAAGKAQRAADRILGRTWGEDSAAVDAVPVGDLVSV